MSSTNASDHLFVRYGKAYAPSILWALFIFILSSVSVLPGFTTNTADFILKKTAHMAVYGVLFVLLHYAHMHTRDQNTPFSAKTWLTPLCICLAYAISDEIHQSFVPGRYGTLRDIGFDLLGSWLALLYTYRYI